MPVYYTNIGSVNTLSVTSSLIASGSTRVTGSVINRIGGFTGSLFGTSSWANSSVSASYVTGSQFNSFNLVLSASYAISASHAVSAEPAFPFTGSAIISGSLVVEGSLFQTASNFSTLSSSLYYRVWSTGGNLFTARAFPGGHGSGGSDGIIYGGISTLPSTRTNATEFYNGSTWSTGGTLITLRDSLTGGGSQNDGVAIGGRNATATTGLGCAEEYNGSVWSGGGTLIVARFGLAALGATTSTVVFGGTNATVHYSCAEEYTPGTNTFVAAPALITARSYLAGVGTTVGSDYGLAVGGSTGDSACCACVESYNGISWTSINRISCQRDDLGATVASTFTTAAVFGGNKFPSGSTGFTEDFDGSIWISSGNMISRRSNFGGNGDADSGLAAGGWIDSSTLTTCTEEYKVGSLNSISFINTNGVIVLPQVSRSLNYANDSAAAAGGIPVGGLYRSASFLFIRTV